MKKAILVLCVGMLSAAHAQSLERSTICNGGSTFTNATFSADWAIGQIATSSLASGSVLLTQGFVQPAAASGNTSILKTTIGKTTCYPNPSADVVNLSMKGKMEAAQVMVFDLTGKLIEQFQWEQNQEFQFSIANYMQGIYMLKIHYQQQSQVFAIAKI